MTSLEGRRVLVRVVEIAAELEQGDPETALSIALDLERELEAALDEGWSVTA